jgi:hypothetical protein
MPDAGTQRRAMGEALKRDVEARRRLSVVKTTPQDEADAALAELKDAVTPTEPQDAEPEQPEPKPAGILHNAHEVQAIQAECQALVNRMAQLGAQPDTGHVQSAAGIFAVMRILVLKGVCTDDEAEGERFLGMRQILRDLLMRVEAEAAARGGVQAVRQPNIIVAKH